MKNKANKIYEQEGVYGDEEKYTSYKDRLNKMMSLINFLPLKPKRILDIGCGTGYFAYQLKKAFPIARIYGVDISEEAISIGQKEYKGIKFQVSDAEDKIHFKDGFLI